MYLIIDWKWHVVRHSISLVDIMSYKSTYGFEWLTYFLDHVHEYDNDYSRDLAELLPYALEAKGILKKS